MKTREYVVVIPERSKSDVVTDLVNLTELLVKSNKSDKIGGFLGGEFGYGCDFKNDTFEIHPYYWGDCTCGHHDKCEKIWESFHSEHFHDSSCLTQRWLRWKQSWERKHGNPDINTNARKIFNRDLNRFLKENGVARSGVSEVTCTCSFDKKVIVLESSLGDCEIDCLTKRPNFKHFESNTEVRWYKYIGRSMEYNRHMTKKLWDRVYTECLESLS